MYRVETPPESPRTEGTTDQAAKESGLSPFLNKMSLKRPREGDEEETDQRMVRLRGMELEMEGKKVTGGKGKGKQKSKGKALKSRRKIDLSRRDVGSVAIVSTEDMVEDEHTTGSGGCPIIATRAQ